MAPFIWLIVGIVMAVAEGLTVQMVAIWFAIGAVGASIAAVLGVAPIYQFLVFILLSCIALALTRPFVRKLMAHNKREATNADQVIGQSGIVRQAIDNDLGTGRVTAMGLDWTARAKDGQKIPEGEKVRVLAIEGVKLIVELQKQEEKQDMPAHTAVESMSK